MKCNFDKNKVDKWASIFKSLGHEKRLEIIFGLLNEKCSVGEIQEKLDISQSNLSQHLRILKESGVLSSEKKGNKVIYYLNNDYIKKIFEYVDLY